MSDVEDLAAYQTRRDAESFRRLVLRYQGMVYSTCSRALGDLPEAEDAAQETFLKLARSAGGIRSNVGAWLHACALSAARHRRRSARARRQREEEWSRMQRPESVEDWRDLAPVVDDCIADLPEDDRELLVQHYFAGRKQTDLAAERGVSQQATAKQLQRIVDALRQGLRGKGVTVSAAVLGALLAESTAEAAVPAALTASLCKMGLAGVPGAGGATAAGVTGVGVLGGKAVAVAAAGVLVVLSGAMAHRHRTKPHTEEAAEVAEPVAQPAPPQDAPVTAVQPAPPQEASPRIGQVVVAAAPAAKPAPPQETTVVPAVDGPAASPAELYTPAALLERIVESEEGIRDWRLRVVCYAFEAGGRVKACDFDWGYSFGREFRSGTDYPIIRSAGGRRYPIRKTTSFDGTKVRILAESLTISDGVARSEDRFGGSVTDIKLHHFRGRPTPKVLLGYELGSGFETLGRALSGAESVTIREEWGDVDGHQCVVLEVLRMRPSAGGKINDGLVWIDPERGYRALKYEKYVSMEPPRRWKYVLLRVDNVKLTLSDGIWFPTEGEVQFFALRHRWPSSPGPGRAKLSKEELAALRKKLEGLSFRERLARGYVEAESSPTKLGKRLLVIPPESIRLNRGIPDEAFGLTFPEGTPVSDDRIQAVYHAGQMPEPGRDWAALEMEFVWVPAMACWAGKYEVSNGDIRHFLQDHDSGAFDGFDLNSDPQPAIATLHQAQAFAKRLTQLERTVERIPDGYEYRLPTADEWTQLARCGDGRVYPWGSNWPPEQGNYSDATSAADARMQDYDDGFPVTCPVADSGCNDWGLFGVGGNVSEWTTDGDGGGVLRGGSWSDCSRAELACDHRVPGDDPHLVGAAAGFRLILSRSPGFRPPSSRPIMLLGP